MNAVMLMDILTNILMLIGVGTIVVGIFISIVIVALKYVISEKLK